MANLGILGYNPLRYYPNGGASFEALAHEIYLQEDEVAFRCDLVTLHDGYLKDFSANNISDNHARNIIAAFANNQNEMNLHYGQGYRNVLITKAPRCNPGDIVASEPHINIGEKVHDLLLRSNAKECDSVVKKLNNFMQESRRKLKKINKQLNTQADMFFLWSPSTEPQLPSFHRKYAIDGAIVASMDFVRGIGIAARMETKIVDGATGSSDTDLKAKLRYALNSLRYNDLVYLHVNAPDEESHKRSIDGKIRILEKLDQELVEPMKKYLDDNYKDKYRIAILPDHYTHVSDGKHADKLVHFVMYGKDIKRDDTMAFSEKSISQKSKSIIMSYEFIDFFIRREII